MTDWRIVIDRKPERRFEVFTGARGHAAWLAGCLAGCERKETERRFEVLTNARGPCCLASWLADRLLVKEYQKDLNSLPDCLSVDS